MPRKEPQASNDILKNTLQARNLQRDFIELLVLYSAWVYVDNMIKIYDKYILLFENVKFKIMFLKLFLSMMSETLP